MKCPRCGEEMEYTIWNTEKGDDHGWHCLNCDVYHPDKERRKNG